MTRKLIAIVDDAGVYHIQKELIECKNCKWCVSEENRNTCVTHGMLVYSDDYCSFAERKNDLWKKSN